MKRVFLLLFVILSLNVNAQYVVNHAQNVDQNVVDGIFYNLPRNVIRLDFEVEQILEMKGKYADFAEELMGIEDCIKDDNTRYNIKSVNVSMLTEADDEMTFHVSIDEKVKENNGFYLDLTYRGCISSFGIKHEKTDHYDNEIVFGNEMKQYDFSNPFHYIPLEKDEEDDDELDEDEVVASANTELSDKEMAQTVVEEIKKVRNAYFDLISGFQEVNYGNTINAMLEELKKMESEYMSLFIGRILKRDFVKTFYVIPEVGTNNYVVTKFSENEGFNAKSGDNVKIVLQNVKSSNLKNLSKDAVKNTTYNNKMVYREPANVEVKLMLGEEIILDNRVQINQLGDFILLPINKMKLEFDKNNGRLISVSRE